MVRKQISFLVLSILILIISSCQPDLSNEGIDVQVTHTENSQVEEVPTRQSTELIKNTSDPSPEPELPNPTPTVSKLPFDPDLPKFKGEFFSTSGECSFCHTNLQSESGENISIDSDWRSSMMANAARDPYYLATVRYEGENHPAFQAIIEDKCATCHLPMARTEAIFANEPMRMLDKDGYLDPESNLYFLAIDGVSCTVCHQIEPDNFDLPESFSGSFIISPENGVRPAFSSYEPDEKFAQMMASVSGFSPEMSDHIQDSAMCATCHTLYTQTISKNGELLDQQFPEQTPYLEWQHSNIASEKSCIDCHMPVIDGSAATSSMGSISREPFSRHQFLGANRYMSEIFLNNFEDLNIPAAEEHIEETIAFIDDQFANQTTQLEITTNKLENQLEINVDIENLAGHKEPTGFPSRRLWLYVSVQDVNEKTIFESGNWSEDGSIIGNDNDVDLLSYEPHYDEISSEDQVQIYEAIFVDSNNEVSTTILEASHYVKDNRLLPAGFEKSTATWDIAVLGNAIEDPDFVGGSDQVSYKINLVEDPGEIIITVQVLYQSISFRWAEKFDQIDSAEANLFKQVYQNTPNIPAILNEKIITVE